MRHFPPIFIIEVKENNYWRMKAYLALLASILLYAVLEMGAAV
jgi:hypothetical protein